MERIVCPRCVKIYRDSVSGRCPVCGAELVTPERWQLMREGFKKRQPLRTAAAPKWGLKFLLGLALGCAAFALIVALAMG